MKKTIKLILKILYFVVTFSVGLILSFVLPVAYREIHTSTMLNENVKNKDFVLAMDLLGGLYNEKYTQIEVNEDFGIVIFDTNSFFVSEENYQNSITESYTCFIYGLDPVRFDNLETNQSAIYLNDNELKISLLQADLDGDGEFDAIVTVDTADYICFTIEKYKINDVSKIKLAQADGSTYHEWTNLSLNFETPFFTDTEQFVKDYNTAVSDGTFIEEENKVLEKQLTDLEQSNESFKRCGVYSVEKIKKAANKSATIFVLIYFVVVYITADLLVGKRYILAMFGKLFNKIFKKKRKQEEIVGGGFKTLVTFEAIVDKNFEKEIVISYKNVIDTSKVFKITLTKEEQYIKKEKIHGGKYVLLEANLEGATIVDLPDSIEISGYNMLVKMNIVMNKNNNLEE